MNTALNALLQILNLVAAGAATMEQIAVLKARVEAMVAAGRDPTAEEWDALFTDIDAQSAMLEQADAQHSAGA
jgi:hypothetical protein